MKNSILKALSLSAITLLTPFQQAQAQNTKPATGQNRTATNPNFHAHLEGLIDHNGNALNADSFGGRHQLVFFGFTNCPSICPMEIQDLQNAIDQMDADKARQVVIVFITIDPQNDKPEKLAAYNEIHGRGRMIGVTGTVDALNRVKKIFGQAGTNNSHSALTYIVDPAGQILQMATLPSNASVSRIKSHVTGCLEMCGTPQPAP